MKICLAFDSNISHFSSVVFPVLGFPTIAIIGLPLCFFLSGPLGLDVFDERSIAGDERDPQAEAEGDGLDSLPFEISGQGRRYALVLFFGHVLHFGNDELDEAVESIGGVAGEIFELGPGRCRGLR